MAKLKIKFKYLIAVAAVFSVVVILIGRDSSARIIPPVTSSGNTVSKADTAIINGPSVRIGSLTIPVDIARTDTEVRKGLSGKESLGQDRGMLFLFAKPDIYRFWMPDMHFSIDIIWINNNKIVDISKNVSKDFNPVNPRFYASSRPAQYVLEVNAGFTSKKNITVGDSVTFKDIN